MSDTLLSYKSAPRSPAKNNALKRAWSLAWTKIWIAEFPLCNNICSIWLEISAKSPTRIGSAWWGVTVALSCSSLTWARYVLTDRQAAGFPTPNRGCHSDLFPLSARIARCLPIMESTVSNARRLGHTQDKSGRDKAGHDDWWTLVFPARSFQTRNAITSSGRAEARDFADVELARKWAISLSRADFCLTHLEDDRCCDKCWSLWAMFVSSIDNLSLTGFSWVGFLR